MASVQLGRADLGLLSDLAGTRLVIPSLMSMAPSRSRDRTLVRFFGDEFPTGFHGEGRAHVYPLTCRYPRRDHAGVLALRYLLDEIAPAAPDSRLLLRTHAGLAPGLDVAVAVQVEGAVVETWSASHVDVAFTVQVVQWSQAV